MAHATHRGSKEALGKSPIGPLLVQMSLPAVIAMGVNALYNVVDTIFIGRGVGPLAIGGVSIAFPIQIIVLACGLLVGIGSASVISRALGANEDERAAQTAGNALFLTLTLGAIVTALGYLLLDPILTLFGATEQLRPYAREYLTNVLPGAAFVAAAVAANHITRSEGHARVAMTVMLIGAVANIILDWIFIYPLDMGVAGAARATVLAQFLSFVFAMQFYIRGKSNIGIKARHLIPDWSLMPEVLALGFAPFVRQIGASVFIIFTNNALRIFASDLHISAFGVIHKVLIFALLPLIGISQGFQPIAGFNFGARRYDRVREALWKTFTATSLIGLLVFSLIQLFPDVVFSVFTDNVDLIEIGRPALRIVMIALPVLSFQIAGAIFFQAIGKAIPSIVLAMSRQILFLIPLVAILPNFFGVFGVWVAFPAADLLSVGITIAWLGAELRHMKTLECVEMPANAGCEDPDPERDVDDIAQHKAASDTPAEESVLEAT